MTNSPRIAASLINAECDVLTALGMVSKIPRNAYRMSIDNDVRDSITPQAHTASLRLNGAGPRVMAPEAWAGGCAYEVDEDGVSETVREIDYWHNAQDNRC